ncbi:HD domain-containing protein [Sphingobacterium suaedae]|uniref:Metal-dependent HD superfamily phosphohydrolase n=1 Tax=Sphingobacterium suaedae TaxID=1686402 RepID=A0ABW5KEK1_9SPHI
MDNFADVHTCFTKLIQRFTNEEERIAGLWSELVDAYGNPGRYYHNLTHIRHMLSEAESARDTINDYDSLLLAVFYHDVVYDPTSTTNEENSVRFAKRHLLQLHVGTDQLHVVEAHILATKNHQQSTVADRNILLDVDLAILGQPWPRYYIYVQAIRREYSMYSDPEYTAGRLAVLSTFLGKDAVYKTLPFRRRYEKQAQKNILTEYKMLTKIKI